MCMNLPLPLPALSSTLVSVQTTSPAPAPLPPASHSQYILFPALPAVELFLSFFVCIILFVIHKVFAKLFFISVPLFVCRISSPVPLNVLIVGVLFHLFQDSKQLLFLKEIRLFCVS